MWPKSDQNSECLLDNVIIPGDNTEKILARRLFAKQTTNFPRHVAIFKLAMYFIWINSFPCITLTPD